MPKHKLTHRSADRYTVTTHEKKFEKVCVSTHLFFDDTFLLDFKSTS